MVTIAPPPLAQVTLVRPPTEDAAVVALHQRYAATAALSEEQRRCQLKAMAEAEHRLPPRELRAVTLARLQAFLRMDEQLPPATVERVVTSLEAVMDELPGDL